MLKRLLLAFMLLLGGTSVHAELIEHPEWGVFFEEAKTQGTFVLYDLNNDHWMVFNAERANTPVVPASTFKIPNSLIALETKVIKSEREVYPWDGIERAIPEWNRDQTLRTAIKYSVVPVYQQFARTIGAKRMQQYLNAFDYGNKDISSAIDSFWLENGSLKISPLNEVKFLVKLYNNALPAKKENQLLVKDILINEATKEYILRAKTGLAGGLGWWVGWIERDDNTYFFACNLDIKEKRNIADRLDISRKILQSQNILP